MSPNTTASCLSSSTPCSPPTLRRRSSSLRTSILRLKGHCRRNARSTQPSASARLSVLCATSVVGQGMTRLSAPGCKNSRSPLALELLPGGFYFLKKNRRWFASPKPTHQSTATPSGEDALNRIERCLHPRLCGCTTYVQIKKRHGNKSDATYDRKHPKKIATQPSGDAWHRQCAIRNPGGVT